MELLYDNVLSNNKAFIRVLPTCNVNWENLKLLNDKKTIYIRALQDFQKGREHALPSYWKFQTDGIFYNSPQNVIFKTATDELFDRILEGNSAIILCFGQTGSGKSMTACGLEHSYEDRGLVPRTIETLFNLKQTKHTVCKMCIQMRYVETNRNYIVDLLSDSDELYDMNSVNRISTIKVKSAYHAMKQVFKAEARKTMKQTKNYSSNLANCVITFIVTTKSLTMSNITVGKLHIVDLCGADTAGNMSCFHKKPYEIGNGNLAKSQLEQFFLILMNNISLHIQVKQRLCIIVRFLREDLNRHCFLRFIGHILIPVTDMRVTISMLHFSNLVRGLVADKLQPRAYTEQNSHVKDLEENLMLLKKEKYLNSMLQNEDLIVNLSQNRYEYIKHLADDYLHDKNEGLVLLNTSDALLAMKVFKDFFNRIENEKNLLAQQIKLQDEDSAMRKEGTFTSKTSKKMHRHSNNSVASSSKSKPVKSRKTSSKDSPTIISKQTSKASSVKVKSTKQASIKGKQTSSVTVYKSESSMANEPPDNLPERIPEQKEAWERFIEDPIYKYQELKIEIEKLESSIIELNQAHTLAVEKMNDNIETVAIRRDELYRIGLIKSFKQQENLDSLTNIEIACTENLQLAETQLIQQKEKVLNIQSDMRINMDHKRKLSSEITALYYEFCKENFSMLLPNLMEEQKEVNVIGTCNKLIEEPPCVIEETDAYKNSVIFNDLQKLMKKLSLRRQREKILNQQWVQSCKSMQSE